jgi:CheY-like chemotaxis protein
MTGCNTAFVGHGMQQVVIYSWLMLTQLLLEPLMDVFRRRFILVADDNQELAVSLSILLKLVGFEVETVHNGPDAVTAAKNRKPDVLLLDVGLPGLNGYQVARQFRSDVQLTDVFIIAISGYSPDMFSDRSTPGDFDHYFTKPVAFNTLLPVNRGAG